MPDTNTDFKIWLPQNKDEAFFDVKLVDSSGTETSVKEDLLYIQVIWPTLREGGLASFNLRLSNNERKYLNTYVKGNRVKIYMDYTDGTTLYKEFYMEEPKYGYSNGYIVYINGRDYPQLADDKITINLSNGVAANDAFSEIVTNNYSGIVTTTGVSEDMNTTIYGGYEYQSAVQVFSDILERVEYDGRIESDGSITTFDDEGILSTTETAILGQNIKSLSGFGAESSEEKNRVQVIGDFVENCPILRMKQNLTQQSLTWKKVDVFKKNSIKTIDDATEVATTKENEYSSLPDSGTLTTTGMFTIKPGQQIMCSVPDVRLVGDYFVAKVTHTFSPGQGVETQLDINESKIEMSTFLKNERERRQAQRQVNNPNSMTDTIIFLDFNTQEGIDSLSNLTLSNGKLKLSAGQSEGTMITDVFVADEDFTEYEIRGQFNDDMELIEVYVSNDGGFNYSQTGIDNFGEKFSLTASDNRVRLKVTLRSDGDNAKPELDSIAVLIKRT